MKVLTIGTFDLLHYGHINLFKRCAEFGEVLVGVNSDDFVLNYKGSKPVMNQETRLRNIYELGYGVVLNTSAGSELIMDVTPDLLVIGSDWARKDYLKQIDITQDELDSLNICLMYVPYTEGISTTEIKKCLKQSL